MNWTEYKTHIKQTDPIGKVLIDEAEVEAAILEARDIMTGKLSAKTYNSGQELFDELDSEDS